MVIDVRRAASDPADAVLAKVRAGCDPVAWRLRRAGMLPTFKALRGSNTLLAFDTAKLLDDKALPLSAEVNVGNSPVGVAATGSMVFVTNSDRFGGSPTQSISVIDAHSLSALPGDIPPAVFREN